MVITDKKLWVKYISSFVIGDGCLALAGKRNNNARYHFQQHVSHKDYVDWQANIIENICPVTVVERKPYTDKNGWNHNGSYVLTSRSLPFFTTIRSRWYIEGKKVVSPHDIRLFDAESLAVWFMDDGCLCKHKKNKINYYWINMATQSFSWADNKFLRDFLADKFDIHADIGTRKYTSGIKYVLNIKKRNVQTFLDTVKPYILPSFQYKLELPHEEHSTE